MVKPHSSIVCSSPAPSYLLQTPSSLHRWDFEGQVGSYYKSREVFQGETTFSTTAHGRSSCTKKKKKKMMMMMMVMLMHLTSFWARIQLKFFCLTWPPMALYSDDTFDSTWPSKIIKMSHYAHFPQRENIIRLSSVGSRLYLTLPDAARHYPILPDMTALLSQVFVASCSQCKSSTYGKYC
jgi:hypothetical protein